MSREDIQALVESARDRAEAIQEESVACFNAARQAGAMLLEIKQQGSTRYSEVLKELDLDKHHLRVILSAARRHGNDVSLDSLYSAKGVGNTIARLMTPPWERKKTNGT
ncbi:MAG: hypothetical protein M3R59_03195 [Verrucomicrobiota bacterium]|nr:hypothetical protein [Verrucomicrobiota bacterium]